MKNIIQIMRKNSKIRIYSMNMLHIIIRGTKKRIINIEIDESELNKQLERKSGYINRKEFIREHSFISCSQLPLT